MKAKGIFPALLLILLVSACWWLPPPTTVVASLDFGDARDPTYPSLLASNGARTQDISQFWLGDTQEPSATSETDAKVVNADELDDGLEVATALIPASPLGARAAGLSALLDFNPRKVLLRFLAVKSATAPAGTVYFNLLADLNGDGEWQGMEEWVVVNQEVDLDPGEKEVIEVPLPAESEEVQIRAALTDTPVPEEQFPNGWDGTGLFKYGEIEDYLISLLPEETPTPEAAWDVYCDPDPLVLDHGGGGDIDLVLDPSSTGSPDTFSLFGVAGLGADADASEISVAPDPPPDPSGQSDFPGKITVASLAVDGPTRTETYVIIIDFWESGSIFPVSIECSVEVVHEEVPTPTPTTEPTPTPSKYILTGISVFHAFPGPGMAAFFVHVRDQAYEGQIWGMEIFFDGVLVQSWMFDSPLRTCQPNQTEFQYQGPEPESIEVHILGEDGRNLGTVTSSPATTGMGKSVPGAGRPAERGLARPGCDSH